VKIMLQPGQKSFQQAENRVIDFATIGDGFDSQRVRG